MPVLRIRLVGGRPDDASGGRHSDWRGGRILVALVAFTMTRARKATLKPCPFCGSASVEVGIAGWQVKCWDCSAKGPDSNTPEESWNRRAVPAKEKYKWRMPLRS